MDVKGELPWDQVLSQARAVKQAQHEPIKKRESEFARMMTVKFDHKLPSVALCGNGRAGKDMAAEYLHGAFGVPYKQSVSTLLTPLLINSTDPVAIKAAHETRHTRRESYYDFANGLRYDDPAFLIRQSIGCGQLITVGVRAFTELHTAVATGAVDLTVWIDNPRVPLDPTMEFGMEDCHVVVRNDGSRLVFFERLRALFRQLYRERLF